MYFKRLEMQGFKSFADPAVIEFHEGVTCIVGPNGSGKSNISDALRWVLGEQSPKMLRGGKMEEVIFSGTASRKSRGMAEVTLVIDNSTGILPIDYNEVAITRRMYRSGESEYLINNNQCRLRDIKELIMDTGIGVDGYSIIGQGKIADIVSSKPESRREIFEEAAGVVMYKSKKAESERKLSSASANLERVNDIISEIEGRIDGLKEDSIKAEEYLKLKERFRELEINITLKNIDRLEAANQTAKDDMADFVMNIEKLSEEKRLLDESIEQKRQKNDNLEKLGSEAKDKLLARVEEISALTGKNQLDAERLNAIERDFNRTAEELEELQEKLTREKTAAAELEKQKLETASRLEAAEESLRRKVEKHSEILQKSAELTEKSDEKRNEMYELYNRETAKRSEARSMESYMESLQQRRVQISEENKAFEQNRDESLALMKEAEQKEEAIEKELIEIKEQINQHIRISAELSDEAASLDKDSSHIRLTLGQNNARKKTIEEMENNYEGYNNAVRFVMKGRLRGIEGVAAELMEVPAGLETAVETAMGASMQNIICKSDGDAKAAVRALKENRAGRATFLPVESVRGSKVSLPPAVISAPGFTGLGCDLIKCDRRYEGIFMYLLGRVAVVETMEDAIAFSKKTGTGVRFVTKDGEIVNASGAITGGKYKNATANLLERKNEIEKLAQQINILEIKAEETEKKAAEIRSKKEYIQKELQNMESKARDLEMQAFNIKAQIENASSNAKDLESGRERREQQLASVDADYNNACLMSRQLNEEAEECLKKAEEIQTQIETLMEEQAKIREEAERASDDITAERIEKNKCQADSEGMTQVINRVNSSIEEISSQMDEKKTRMSFLEDERKEILCSAEGSEETVKVKEQEKENLERYIVGVTSERETLAAELTEMSKEQSVLGEQINTYRDRRYQQEIKLAKNETQLDTLKEKLWEDFEVSYLQALQLRKEDFVMSSAQKEDREIRNRLKELGDVNVGSIKEYAQVRERYQFLTEQRKDITEAMEQLQAIVDDMEKTIKSRFKENFDKVVISFEETFKELFGGGHAELRLDDEENPLEAGIEIIAQPPGKKLQNINLMSGGEKTMTAIALMFAVLQTTPTPFCILDEVEAALDDTNIDRFSRYLRNFHDIQFAIVTHQKATMEHADVLYGVTMPEKGVSKILSLRLGDEFKL